MVDILVRPAELRQTAEELGKSTMNIKIALEVIDRDIASLKGDNFMGHRADLMQARYSPKRDALINAYKIVIQFSKDLRNAADLFEVADRGKKKVVYLINGINYNGDGKYDKKLDNLKKSIENQYGVEVCVVGFHPYDTRLLNDSNVSVEAPSGWWSDPAKWVENYINSNKDLQDKALGALQVLDEYRTGGGNESKGVFNWINDNLNDLVSNGLIDKKDLDVVLFGHSGGGAIAANIVDDIENMGVDVSGMVTAGSPVSNYDHALKYVDTIVDIQHKDDLVGRLGENLRFPGSIRSDEARDLIPEKVSIADMYEVARQDNLLQDESEKIIPVSTTDGDGTVVDIDGNSERIDEHGSYFYSNTVVDAFKDVLW